MFANALNPLNEKDGYCKSALYDYTVGSGILRRKIAMIANIHGRRMIGISKIA